MVASIRSSEKGTVVACEPGRQRVKSEYISKIFSDRFILKLPRLPGVVGREDSPIVSNREAGGSAGKRGLPESVSLRLRTSPRQIARDANFTDSKEEQNRNRSSHAISFFMVKRIGSVR
jgi:hypothetical protein